MSWSYSQSTGVLKHNSKYVSNGYSGYKEYKNKPSMQGIR